MTFNELFQTLHEFIILMKMPNLVENYNSESEYVSDEETYNSDDNFIEKDSE